MFEGLRKWLEADRWHRSVSVTCTGSDWRVAMYEPRLNTCTEIAVGRAATIEAAEQTALAEYQRESEGA